ncbi:MAG: hypothetical protein HYT80_00615 [Euryarchaeota archaeon]|nr:hypothetical protein [Euryarchaeota archaeon]
MAVGTIRRTGRRHQRRRTLAAVLFASTAFLLLATQVVGSMARNHEGPFAALEFDVPVGRLGDEVVYLLEGGAATERRGLLVEGVNKTHDRFGALRKTLQVLRTGEHASDVLSRLDLDLATRDVIRSRALWLPRAGDQISDVQLGPSSPYVSLPVNLTEVRFQGVHLRLGDDHSARLFDAERAALVRLGPRDFDYVARVDRSGTWNGTPALGVASTLRYSFGAGVGASSVVVDEVVWWTATHAYPVEMERTLTWTTASERGSNRSTWILIGLKAGTEPIPWDASGVTTAGQSAAPLERAAGSALEDGRKTRMAFSLREALASIEADKTLVDFQAWKQSHANARIVHLEFSGGVWADETSWLVVWLEAPGSAFSVLSVKTGGSVANHDRTWPLLHEQVFWSSPGATTWTGQPAAEIRWPDHPITIAAADELARLHVPSKWHDSGLGYFVWGPYTRSNEPGPDLRMFLYYRAVDNSRFTAIVDSNQGTVDMLWQRTFPAQGRSLTCGLGSAASWAQFPPTPSSTGTRSKAIPCGSTS